MSELRQKVEGNEILDVVAAGNSSSRVLDRVGRKVQEILAEARKEYDMVFIDAPPMLHFAEPIQLACMADGVLLVSQAGHTSRQAVSSVIATLRRLNANTLGLVLNQVHLNMSSSYRPYPSYYQQTARRAMKSA